MYSNNRNAIKLSEEQQAELDAVSAAVAAETGWPEETAARNIILCWKNIGVNFRDYAAMKMYMVAPEKQAAHYEQYMKKRVKLIKARKSCLAVVTEATGWPEDEALEKIDACRETWGISYGDYARNMLWEKAPDELEAFCTQLGEQRRKERRDRKRCLSAMIAATGLPEKLALAQIEECRERLGVSYHDFKQLKLWAMSDKEQRSAYRRLRRKRERRELERQECLAAVVSATGWSEEEALEKMEACRKELGIRYRDYQALELWDKEPEEQAAAYEALLAQRGEKGETDAEDDADFEEDSALDENCDDAENA